MIRRRFMLAGAAATATLATLALPVSHIALWNLTASTPAGLYMIEGKADLRVGERAAITPPPQLRRLLARRGLLASGMPLIKRVAALGGQHVCRFGHGVTIDGRLAALALARDHLGRPLPAWFGCQTLRSGEVFVLNPDAPGSFDGRYFGVLRISDVIGRAVPVWTDERGDGDYEWFADPRSSLPPVHQPKETER